MISCIVPTTRRRAWCLPLCIETFKAQDYAPRELIIVTDADEDRTGLYRFDARITVVKAPPGASLGAKRNLGCAIARGDFIAHFDDDDWRSPDWLYEATKVLEDRGVLLAGLQTLFTHELASPRRTFVYEPPRESRWWVAGASLVYDRRVFQRHQFPDKNSGEDTAFVHACHQAGLRFAALDPARYVWQIHDDATGSARGWDPEAPELTLSNVSAEKLMGADYARWIKAYDDRTLPG